MIPLTIVSGYLGAGKTSLINHFLSGDHGLRAGVLVNDFGALNVDAALIENRDGATVALQNGCVCCSMADDLVAGLDRLLNGPAALDCILVEASGVADPGKVALLARTSSRLAPGGIVGLVDAARIREQARDKFIAALVGTQLRRADLLILNKVDLVGGADLADLHAWLAEVSGGRPVLTAAHGDVPIAPLLGTPSRTPEPVDEVAPPEFRTVRIDLPTSIVRKRLEEHLAEIPGCIYRIKGMLLIGGAPCLLQTAGRRWTLSPWTGETDALPPALVVIGTGEMDTAGQTWLATLGGLATGRPDTA